MSETIANGLYWVARQILRIINILQSMFDLFAGGSEVTYNGKTGFLTDLFFSNDKVTIAYGIMAMVGIALSVGFALAAIMRRIFDAGGRGQLTLGRILSSMIRSIALILVTNSVVTAVFSSTNMLLSYIHYSTGITSDADVEIKTDDEMRAAMARALNTLGNYSLNDAYTGNLNVNLCFNDMRGDLLFLDEFHVFDIDYDPEKNGDSWQSVLAKIAGSTDLSKELYPAADYPQLSSAVISAMDIIRTNTKLPLLSDHSVEAAASETALSEGLLSFDTVLFLLNTMDAARSEKQNEAPDIADTLRNPYYIGAKSIYDVESVKTSFDITRINYVILFLSAAEVLFALVVMLFNCITRIFSMIFLYIISPGFFAVMPFDDGTRTREWIKLFLVQALAVFATVIPMKLITLFVPIILDMGLLLFEDSFLNQMAKLLLILGAFEAARRASTMLSKLITESNPGSAIGSYEIKELSKSLGRSLGKQLTKAINRVL